MKASPSRRLRLAGLLFILALLFAGTWHTYFSKSRTLPPREWLVVLSEPVLALQTNEAGTFTSVEQGKLPHPTFISTVGTIRPVHFCLQSCWQSGGGFRRWMQRDRSPEMAEPGSK